ncbi:amidohydrolase [Alsobacter soli]|uniref:Amidohydrolase n=1 Tax=Alsobacter soli TaxID=2109933 RepID=A0A2T1HQM8_9HYPH|nr:amidohydrolase [Alsobacter soli]
MRIDAHQHFWNPARGDYGWLTPELQTLYRPFSPDDLELLIEEAGVGGTVLVQAAPTVEETEYMLGLADATDWVLGVVGWVDFNDPKHIAHVDRLARHKKLKGFRPMIQDIPDVDWMLKPELDWAFRCLVAHDLAFDALVRPEHLDNLLALLTRYPDLRAVVDHAAKPRIRAGAFDEWAGPMARIARETDAKCKLSGLVTEASANWSAESLQPYVDHLLEVFGPGRLIWGSDWPVCTLASSYQRWVDATEELLTSCSAGERLAIFGGNAASFYRLGAV